MRRLATTLLPIFLLTLSAPALAVYKCESGGRIGYSDTPCAGGKPLYIDSAPDSTADRHRLAQEKAELKQLENTRHKQEALDRKKLERTRKAQAAQRKKCATLALRQKWAEQDAAAAGMKAAASARRKARRAQELYQANCG